MMAQKQLMLHELLKEEQEPFDLKSFISDKRSKLINNKYSSSPERQKSKQIKNAGFGFFGSFFKILKDRGKIFRNCDQEEGSEKTDFTISCSGHEVMICGNFELLETRFCTSPFIFSSSGIRTPESCSPAASPCPRRRRCVNQEKENYEHSDNGNGVGEEDKEQCSPVSVLDSFFEDDEHKSINEGGEDDDDEYDHESSYANVQRAKEQLLERLRRFEKLAELDPMELERKFLEDEDYQIESSSSSVASDDHGPSISLSPDVKQSVDRFLNDAFCLSNLQRKMCTNLIMVEKKNKEEFVLEFDLDLKGGMEGREKTVEEIELAVFGYLVDELLQELN